ncbi:MAG: CTP synthase [Lachnospiraceae bacterium]|nr:CTP synthase [Lachnospiraceae bacterium]
MKIIFITGGVVSGLGKGICAASLARLLKARGFKVLNQKLDPYLNVDPGTMSPYQHGEVFVTDDGAETDLDLGHYERFADEPLSAESSISSGKIYWNVLNRERRGEYLGRTVQIIPHITDEIRRCIYAMEDKGADVLICEIGGTVGDIESQPYLEAARQIFLERERGEVLSIHVPLVTEIPGSRELKSKPVQHSVRELQAAGIRPDILVCRTDQPLTEDIREKIGLFCSLDKTSVIQSLTADSIYAVPLMFEEEGLADIVCRKLSLPERTPDLAEWTAMVERVRTAGDTVRVALVGKYVQLHDAYLSIEEALHHAAAACGVKAEIDWIDSEELTENNIEEILSPCDGILVPGGFGSRGIEGMILAAKYARERRLPYFGICLGMQIAVIEFARDVLGFSDANSTEFDESTTHPVIDLMPEQKTITDKGGTMRLGSWPCRLKEDSLSAAAYGELAIDERHRHRYEFNNDYRSICEANGMRLAGLSPDDKLVEIIEITGGNWFVGVQFHPEFKSRPNRPHPLFTDFCREMKRRHEACTRR